MNLSFSDQKAGHSLEETQRKRKIINTQKSVRFTVTEHLWPLMIFVYSFKALFKVKKLKDMFIYLFQSSCCTRNIAVEKRRAILSSCQDSAGVCRSESKQKRRKC